MTAKIITALKDIVPASVKKVIRQVDKYSAHPRFFPISMYHDEQAFFDRVTQHSNCYLEFGAGGSTFRVLNETRARIISVESSAEWIATMREYSALRRAQKDRLTIYKVDIGPTGPWGFPVGSEAQSLYQHYSWQVFQEVDLEKVDTVFIDGRFRIACTLAAILHLREYRPQIMIHDFTVRNSYRFVLKYLDIVDQVQTLVLFRIKDEVSMDEVKADYEKFKLDPA